MAKINASVYTSHVPAIGAALDLGKSEEPYWKKFLTGTSFPNNGLKKANRM